MTALRPYVELNIGRRTDALANTLAVAEGSPAAVQGIDKTSIDGPSLPDSGTHPISMKNCVRSDFAI
jgi:hypothetical protein